MATKDGKDVDWHPWEETWGREQTDPVSAYGAIASYDDDARRGKARDVLASAAPDLYRALEAVQTYLRDPSAMIRPTAQVEAALRKARGK